MVKKTSILRLDSSTIKKDVEQLKQGLKFAYVSIQTSSLGGVERPSILITISTSKRDNWANGILENSNYAKIHISHTGVVEHFSGWRLKLRKFTAKDIPHAIQKINAIKRV